MTESIQLKVKVEIERCRILVDPNHDIFNVTISNDDGEWYETFGSDSDLQHFLKGLQVHAEIMGSRLEIPEVPLKPGSVWNLDLEATRESPSPDELDRKMGTLGITSA
jgi:hypothetical protein